jgi:PAS domain S-box-containing protein
MDFHEVPEAAGGSKLGPESASRTAITMADPALTAPSGPTNPATITALLARHPTAVALVASAGGLAAWGATGSPLALLPVAAAAFLLAPGRAAGLLAALGAAFVVAALLPVPAAWAALFGLGLLLGAIVAAAAASPGGAVAQPAAGRIHPDDRPAAEQAAARAFWSGIPQVVTCRQRQPDGSWRVAELRAEPGYRIGVEVEPLVDLPGAAWTTTDDAGETGEAIRAARVVEALHGAAFAFDAAGRFTYATPIAQTSIAMTLEDLNRPLSGAAFLDGGDLGWKRGVHPDDYAAAAAHLRDCLRSGEPFNHEYRVLRATGDYVWHRFAIRPTRAPDGHVTGWYGIGFDIDVYKRTEAALREREQTLAQLVDLVPSHIWRLTAEGEPVFYNRRMVDFLGFDIAGTDRPGMSQLDALVARSVHPDDAAPLTTALRRCIATGAPFAMRYRLRRADGIWRWMSSRADPLRDADGRIVQWYGLCHDIDEFVQAKDALQRRERQLEQLIDALPVHIVSWTPAGALTYVSRRYLEQTGLTDPSFEEFARATQALVHPDDAERVRDEASAARAAGRAFAMRYRRRLPDGSYRWMDGRFEPQQDAEGRITEWFGLAIDVDDEVRVQDELRERERFLWQLVETLPAMIVCSTPDGEPIYRSQQLRAFLGYGPEDLDGQGKSRLHTTLDASIHPDDLADVKRDYGHALATSAPYARRHRLRRADGAWRWVETRAAPMRDAGGAIVQWTLICLDIDGEVKAQEALRRAQDTLARAAQAASLAELSASIAHEVNQPLAAIAANSGACLRWLSAAPPNLDRAPLTADRNVRDANGAAEVVSRIRALFRSAPEARAAADLDAVIREARELTAGETARREARVDVKVEAGLPPVSLDRVQIQQVLVNLIRNGLEAMDGIEGERRLTVRASRTAEGVRVEVCDSGPGLAFPERAFEAFFTTKPQGMGMGLAICRSIVEAHGGRLWAEANAPCGARFAFTLPVGVEA